MYLDDEGPIAGGREIWGFPEKLASPKLCVDGKDTLLGTLDYGTQRIATGTMGLLTGVNTMSSSVFANR
jgi:acetoacetate decarboxylase